jgi:hypothetical protein
LHPPALLLIAAIDQFPHQFNAGVDDIANHSGCATLDVHFA